MQMDLRLGAAVRGLGGEHVGTLRRVLVDDQGEVEEIVVRLDGGLEALIEAAPEVRVPARQVASATEDGVRLHASRDELEAYPITWRSARPRHATAGKRRQAIR